MADDTLVLSNLLCFLSSKYGKCTAKVLKSALIDFIIIIIIIILFFAQIQNWTTIIH